MENTNFSVENPENRYRVVKYQPTINDLQQSILQLNENDDGQYIELMRYKDYYNFSYIHQIFSFPYYFFELINILFDDFPEFFIGFQDVSSGKIYDAFFKNVISYHPDEGYVIIVRKYCHELSGNDTTLKVVSLKTGKEFEQDFFGPTSGIRNLQFSGLEKGCESISRTLYIIDESNQQLVESAFYDCSVLSLPNANYMSWNENQFDIIKNPRFYQLDKSFIDYKEMKKQIEILGDENNFPFKN